MAMCNARFAVLALAASLGCGAPGHALSPCFARIAAPQAPAQTRIVPAVYATRQVERVVAAGALEWRRSDNQRLSAVSRVDPEGHGAYYLVPGPARREIVSESVLVEPERVETIAAPQIADRLVPVLCPEDLTPARSAQLAIILHQRGFLRSSRPSTPALIAGFADYQRQNGDADIGLLTIVSLTDLGLLPPAAPVAPVPAAPLMPESPALPEAPAAPEIHAAAHRGDEPVRRYSVQREIIRPADEPGAGG